MSIRLSVSGGSYNVRESEISRADTRPPPKSLLRCRVHFLDDSEGNFEVDRAARGQVLLDKVFEHLELIEKDFFGLQYLDDSPDANVMRWVDPVKPVKKQMIVGPPFVLYFRVKFFVADPSKLKEEYTRYHFFLQIKRDILEGRLVVPYKTSILLASYAVQSELGDYSLEEHPPGYLSVLRFVPGQTEDFERQVSELHRQHLNTSVVYRHQSPADAEQNYLELVRRQDMYGADLQRAQLNDNTGLEVQVGVTCVGLLVFQNSARINTLPWSKIVRLSFKRKQLLVQLRKEVADKDDSNITFTMLSYRSCKNIWKSCVEHHTFFRLHAPPQPRASLFSFQSKFRYSGRTEFETMEETRKRAKIARIFTRTPSKRYARRTIAAGVTSVRDSYIFDPALQRWTGSGKALAQKGWEDRGTTPSMNGYSSINSTSSYGGVGVVRPMTRSVPAASTAVGYAGAAANQDAAYQMRPTNPSAVRATLPPGADYPSLRRRGSGDKQRNMTSAPRVISSAVDQANRSAVDLSQQRGGGVMQYRMSRVGGSDSERGGGNGRPEQRFSRVGGSDSDRGGDGGGRAEQRLSRSYVDYRTNRVSRSIEPVGTERITPDRTAHDGVLLRSSPTKAVTDSVYTKLSPPVVSGVKLRGVTDGFTAGGVSENGVGGRGAIENGGGDYSNDYPSNTNGGGGMNGGKDLVTIRMKADSQGRYGFNVKGGAELNLPIIVSRVAPGTPADLCIPRLNEGDQVLLINGRDVSHRTHEQVVQMCRNMRQTLGAEMVLVVRPNVYIADDEPDEPDVQFVPDSRPHHSPMGGPSGPGTGGRGGGVGVDALSRSIQLLHESLETGASVGQFEQLYRKKSGMTMNIAKLQENLNKNRYRDISPYDQTRVKIKSGVNGDYINANYVNMEIPRSGIVNRYIAAQGPLPNTSVDFWQMVWEQHSSLLVMLTTESERGRVKCHQYWPDLCESVHYGRLTVSCTSEELTTSFAFRDFTLRHSDSVGEERQIRQMQYISWPDHGVPDDNSDFLGFVLRVRQYRTGMVEPSIIHCSAGIGRTGVLITMETALCLIEANQPVYPLDIVRQMRDQRAMLIQTASQYKFVCEAIVKVYKDKVVQPLDEFK